MKFVVIPPEGIDQVNDDNGVGVDQPRPVQRLYEAAQSVQDVAYSLATSLDNTTMTDLMVTSRKLERLAERIKAAHPSADQNDGEDSGRDE